jgi:hypothetical protein
MRRSEKFKHLLSKALSAPVYNVTKRARKGSKSLTLRLGGWFNYVSPAHKIEKVLGIVTLTTMGDPYQAALSFLQRRGPNDFVSRWHESNGAICIAVFSQSRPGNNGKLWWKIDFYDVTPHSLPIEPVFAFSFPPPTLPAKSETKREGGGEYGVFTTYTTPHPYSAG